MFKILQKFLPEIINLLLTFYLQAQLSTITQTTDYSKLEKCYSIWICAEDVPKKLQNTLTEYSFSKKDIIGVADEPEVRLDHLLSKESSRNETLSCKFLRSGCGSVCENRRTRRESAASCSLFNLEGTRDEDAVWP